MRLKCTIGTQKLRDGRTYERGDEYELDDEKVARVLTESGYAVEVKQTEDKKITTKRAVKQRRA